jgi:transposase
MPKSHRPYPPEFRQRIIDLVRRGRTPEELARQFEPSAQAIRNWVRQADRDDGRRQDGLTTLEQDELRRLSHEDRALHEEREILRKEGRRCPGGGRRPSMDSVGDVYDHALCESFFATLEVNCWIATASGPDRRPARCVRLHREPVQPAPPSFRARWIDPRGAHVARAETRLRDHVPACSSRTARMSGSVTISVIGSRGLGSKPRAR